jgi:zinc protease
MMPRRFLLGVALLAAGLVAPAATLAAESPAGYVIVVSQETLADPAWGKVVAALLEKHRDRSPIAVTWEGSPDEALETLAEHRPRHACFVARPDEAGREFVEAVHRLCRRIDDDPYGDVLWGILTGFDAANALAIAETSAPLVIQRVTAGTELAMDRVVEGEWFCELTRNRMVRKVAGGEAREERGPDDTTAALAARLTDGQTDLLVTSGHATERDWQIGFRYRNGSFRSGGGRLWGVDTAGKKLPIESNNPKVWLPVGNCLAGHIDGPDALALAFMNGAGVRQMIGYTVPTWFGYAGWGMLDYFVEQPGRYTLCESFHANDHALVHRLVTRAAPGDEEGLVHDRDVVALYGDPAWEARLAEGTCSFKQTLTEVDGTFTLEIEPLAGAKSFAPVNTNGSQRGGRPIVAFLPRRIGEAKVVAGEEWKPVITDDFVLVPLPPAGHVEPIRIVFQGLGPDG